MLSAERLENFKTNSSNDKISHKETKNSIPVDFSSSECKEDALCLTDVDISCIDFEKKSIEPTGLKKKLQFNSSNVFAQNAMTDEKSRKRTYSKPCPKSKKKSKIESCYFNDDEKKLDDDLLGIVGSINTNNLDSDSSGEDTLEIEDTVCVAGDKSIDAQSIVSTNIKSYKEKNTSSSAIDQLIDNSLKPSISIDGSEYQTNSIEGKKGIELKPNVVFKEISSSVSKNNNSFATSVLFSNSCLTINSSDKLSKNSKSKPNVALKEISSSVSKNNNSSATSDLLSNSCLTINSSDKLSKNSKSKPNVALKEISSSVSKNNNSSATSVIFSNSCLTINSSDKLSKNSKSKPNVALKEISSSVSKNNNSSATSDLLSNSCLTINSSDKLSKNSKSKPNVALKEISSSVSKNNNSSATSALLSDSCLTINSSDKLSKNSKSAKKKKDKSIKDNASNVEPSFQDIVNNKNSDVCQTNKTLNPQSIYASMGLDEDLCDTEQTGNKISKSVSKAKNKTANPEKIGSLSEVKIKTEKEQSVEACCYKKINEDKNENLTVDGCHVSMTFEAEPPCDDGEEEDIPLLKLKTQKPVDMINTPIKSEPIDLCHQITLTPDKMCITTGKSTNFPSPSFIKKEMIENGISQGQSISSDNCSLISNVRNNTSDILFPIKIKTEPVDTEYSYGNCAKTDSLTSPEPYKSQLLIHSSNKISEKSPEKNKNTNVSTSPVATDLPKENSVLAELLQNKNLSSASVSSINVQPNITSNSDVLNTHSSLSKSIEPVKPVTKKSTNVNKKKKVVKKKTANVVKGLNNSLTHITTQWPEILSNNVNSLNEPILNNSDKFYSTDLNKSSTDVLVTPIKVTKKQVTGNKKRIRVKTKSTPKKSNLTVKSDLSLTVPKSDPIADDKTLDNQENITMDYDTSVQETKSQTNSSQKGKRKRGATVKGTNIDENLPITLLIKRQKSDTDADSTDSFHCLNITRKLSNAESSAVNENAQKNNLDQCQGNSSSQKDIDSNVLSAEISTVPQNTKKKSKAKKKKASKKKKAKRSPSLTVSENEMIPTDFLSSVPNEETNSYSAVHTTLQEPFCEKSEVLKEKDDSDSATESELNDLSSQGNMHVAASEESLSSSSFQTLASANINSQSEMSNFSSVLPKKKKRRPRSYGWYKKKKTKKDRERAKARKKLKSADNIQAQDLVSDLQNDPLLFTVKTPIVVIENLNSEIHNLKNVSKKVVYDTSEIQSSDCNRANSSEPVESASKSVEFSDSDTIEADSVQNEFSAVSEGNSKNHSLETIINDDDDDDDVTIIDEVKNNTVESNTTTNNEIKMFPSLNIREFQKDIAALEALFENQSKCARNSENLGESISRSNLKTVSNQADKPTEDVQEIQSTSSSGFDASLNTSQSSHNLDTNSIALKIKKEVTNMKSKSTNNSFRDQNDLIEHAFASSSKQSSDLCSNSSNNDSVRKTFSDSLNSVSQPQSLSTDLINSNAVSGVIDDDDIEVIEENAKKSQNVTEVILSDDDDDNTTDLEERNSSISEQNAISHKAAVLNEKIKTENVQIPHQNQNSVAASIILTDVLNSNVTSTESNISVLAKKVKAEKNNSEIGSAIPEISNEFMQTSVSSNQLLTPCQAPNQIQNSVDLPKVFTDVSDSNLTSTESCISEDTDILNIVKDKYVDDYFKHPFCYKRRINKKYMRIDSKVMNLPLHEVESRLKSSENLSQGGKNPISKSEVECFHRILGVAPSKNLIPKCYTDPNKNFHTPIDFSKDEHTELEPKEAFHLTVSDILRVIAEGKMKCKKFDDESNAIDFIRDCPSTETRDSFDSGISRSTDKFINVIPDKNVEQLNSEFLTENKSNFSSETPLSCTTNFKDLSGNAYIDFQSNTSSGSDINSVIKSSNISNFSYLENNALGNLNLVNKEATKILNSTGTNHLASFETPDSFKCSTELKNTAINSVMTNEASLPPSYSHLDSGVQPVASTEVSQTVVNTSGIFNIINMPVVELRKILETVQSTGKENVSLKSDNVVNDNVLLPGNHGSSHYNNNHATVWNKEKKETFDYNHTSKEIPDSNQNMDIQKDFPDDAVKSVADTEEQTGNENSDDEYVDNEPIHHDSDEKSDSSSHENEEPAPVPQYKSKWEKIMERKSQENEKGKVSELYLKDCVPVTSGVPVSSRMKPQKKTDSLHDKLLLSKNSKKQEETINSKAQNNKSAENKKGKQTESKSKKETKDEKTNKSQTSKKLDKLDSKTDNSEPSSKKSPLKKNKCKEIDEKQNLFVPDKLISSPVKRNVASAKSNEKNKPKRFYGNRVTNRGTFLTETNQTKSPMAQIKIPKKKASEETKKPSHVQSENFHSMVKSPDINIDLPRMSSNKNFNKSNDNRKNSESYRSPLPDLSRSVTSHFIRTKRMRDKQNAYFNSRSQYGRKSFPESKRPSLLPTPYPRSDETVPRSPILNNPPNHHSDNLQAERIPVLTTTSFSPPANSHFSDSFQSNMGPSKEHLQEIMSLVHNSSNIVSEIKDNVLPNSEIDVAWNSQYNLPYGVAEPSVIQNISSPPNLPIDSIVPVNNPFRNESQVDSLNLQRIEVPSQHNVNLPFNSIPPVNAPFADSVDPHRANLELQYNLFSNSITSGLTDSLDPRRAAVGVKTNIPSSSTNLLDPRRAAFVSQSTTPVGSLVPSTPFVNTPLSEPTDPRRGAQGIYSNCSNQLETSLNVGSQVLRSPPFTAPIISTPQPSTRKATCLVPSNLKTLVGYETIETHNVQLLMLEWSVDWLIQQQKMPDPPPISNALRKVSTSYTSFQDYYNTYFPLMLLETWHRIYVSWTHLNQTAPFVCQITSYSVKSQYVRVECQTVFSTDYRRKGVFPDEGSILMVKYSTKSNEYTIRILGYVTQVKTRRYNPVTDSKLCSSLPQHIEVSPDSLQILTLTFMGAYNSEDIDKHQPVRVHVLCTVKQSLKQNEAMLYINKSPLQRSILNPVADGLLSVSLAPRNSPEDKVNECVRDITKGILSPHPLPLLTIVKAKPESDRMNIIPLLIQKMKTTYKTKVLLCVRTVKALGEIAANICLQQSLNLVIINKRCDTNLQFQKYLLDELVSCELKRMEQEKSNEKILKNDASTRIRKQIIKDCDVILSLIRYSHDEFLCSTLHETESVAQMCCIVDEANLCTEPETLIPIMHGISKLILIGDPQYTAKVLSKKASAYDFNRSFFLRAYELDLSTD